MQNLSFLSKLKKRMPWNVYRSLHKKIASMDLSLKNTPENPNLWEYIATSKRSFSLFFWRCVGFYFFGNSAVNRSMILGKVFPSPLYHLLEKHFSGSSDFFDFDGIKIPKARTREVSLIFDQEIADLLMSPHVPRPLYAFWEIEGPYEFSNDEGDVVQVRENDIVIDAGANVGLFSAYAVSRGAKAYAFEPNQSVIDEYLSKTAEWNDNITICPYALYNKEDVLEFLLPPDTNIGSGKVGAGGNKEDKTVSVQAVSLDVFVKKHNLPRVDFIKADIEGAERYMLMGAQETLRVFKPRLALCTYHLPDDRQVMRDLILKANPSYTIVQEHHKLYAW
ncbi:MAG: FkbM family methyltransferase [Synergistaceae bacterium]|jgi:FkbM family methyltransferase|nr:FkbM family methyltransferase [Synergistaceae bacterium]